MMMNRGTLGALFTLALVFGVASVGDAGAAEKARAIYPAGNKPIAPYSPGMQYGDLLFISGQIPYVNGAIPADASDGVDDIQDQTRTSRPSS